MGVYRRGRLLLTGIIGGTALAIASAGVLSAAPLPPREPTEAVAQSSKATKLTKRELAAAVLFGCANSANTSAQRNMAAAGVGGIVLLGTNPPANLAARLRSVRKAAPKKPGPLIASDEEGGTVQRLSRLIYPLPSAESMSSWSKRKLRSTARRYGNRMTDLGIGMSLAPVADLRVPGSYLDKLNRAFSTSPGRTGRAVKAWSAGLRRADVIPVVKHWPGHGHAADTHTTAARVPSYAQLRRADLKPFQRFMTATERPVVMVAHVQSKGLTAPGVPATQSAKAIRVLREQAGPEAVIVTDSLSMAAATSARGLSESGAVVAALQAGVDWAMVCTSNIKPVISAVVAALRNGDLSREQLETSLARIRALRG